MSSAQSWMLLLYGVTSGITCHSGCCCVLPDKLILLNGAAQWEGEAPSWHLEMLKASFSHCTSTLRAAQSLFAVLSTSLDTLHFGQQTKSLIH